MDTWKYDNAQKYSVTLSLEKEQTVTIVTMKGKDELGVYTTSTKEAAKFEIPTVWDIERKLLMRALNNRTRERNYANICLMLAEGQISEEEFEREISTNENRYVVSFRDLRPEEVRLAAQLTRGVLDVDTEDDFRELFSINSKSMTKALAN